MSRTCVVTGAQGFLGRNLVEHLSASDDYDRVVAVDILPGRSLGPGVETLQEDAADPDVMLGVCAGADVVFHLAAASNVDEILKHPALALDLNIGMTCELLKVAAQAEVGRFVFVSTTWVYMSSSAEAASESDPVYPPVPSNLYAATKVAAEVLSLGYAAQVGLPVTVLRPSAPYGRYMRPEMVVHRFVSQAMRGDPLTIAGSGRQSRQFVFAADVARAFIAGARAPHAAGRVYNVTGSRGVSIRELAEIVADVVPNSGGVRFVDGRQDDHRGRVETLDRASTELGWSPVVDLREGIEAVYRWLSSETPAHKQSDKIYGRL